MHALHFVEQTLLLLQLIVHLHQPVQFLVGVLGVLEQLFLLLLEAFIKLSLHLHQLDLLLLKVILKFLLGRLVRILSQEKSYFWLSRPCFFLLLLLLVHHFFND